jgi:hypothetical protein
VGFYGNEQVKLSFAVLTENACKKFDDPAISLIKLIFS